MSRTPRGRSLKVDLKMCTDEEMKKRWEDIATEKTQIVNDAKSTNPERKITKQDKDAKLAALNKERDELIDKIEDNVKRDYLKKTGDALTTEAARRKAEKRKISMILSNAKKITECGEELEKGNEESSGSMSALLKGAKKVCAAFPIEATEEMRKAAEEEQAAKKQKREEKEGEKRKKLEELQQKDPEKYEEVMKKQRTAEDNLKVKAAAKAAKEEAAAEAKAAAKAAKEKAAADKKAAALAKKLEDAEKTAAEKSAAHEKAAADKKAAEEKRAADAAEEKAAADKKAAEEKAAADKKAAEDKAATYNADLTAAIEKKLRERQQADCDTYHLEKQYKRYEVVEYLKDNCWSKYQVRGCENGQVRLRHADKNDAQRVFVKMQDVPKLLRRPQAHDAKGVDAGLGWVRNGFSSILGGPPSASARP